MTTMLQAREESGKVRRAHRPRPKTVIDLTVAEAAILLDQRCDDRRHPHRRSGHTCLRRPSIHLHSRGHRQPEHLSAQ